ncbi:hypothetical protein [Burkholderia gladioli]|uniref:hypothetical protein n=1 Tax=Burkholderia gladioli TaxID=28095 RepID=UPI002FDFE133
MLTAAKLNLALVEADLRAADLASEAFSLKLAVGVLAALAIGAFVMSIRGRSRC